MGTEGSLKEIMQNKEIIQTEYNNIIPYNAYNMDYFNTNKNKKGKNYQKKLYFKSKNNIINKPKSLTNIFLFNEKKKEILNQNNPTLIFDQKLNNTNLYFDYFKCITCPMCVLIQINPKNNLIKIKCENGHENEINIDSFNSIYQTYKYTCDKCKKIISSKYFYCNKCKELYCDSCAKKNLISEVNKGHIFLNETEVNFFCYKHKKKFVNFCKNCQKNCCKKCCIEHNTHELLLIKNEIRDNAHISQIAKMINKEKELIEEIEKKFPLSIFKDKNKDLLNVFKRLISLRKKENQLKQEILNKYLDFLKKININNTTNISSTTNIGEVPSNFLMNYYFLKSVNELENIIISSIPDFFDFSEDNKYSSSFSSLKEFLFSFQKNLITPEKNLDKLTKRETLKKKPRFIFPLDDGNFIVTYETKIIFYDGLNGNELLIIDEEIFDYTYRIIKLPDKTLLFFGDFLNHVNIDNNGSIKVLFTGSHVDILQEVVLDDNNLVFIDKITKKLKTLTNKDINWHKEIFIENKQERKTTVDFSTNDNINNSFMTMNQSKEEAEKLFMNSLRNMRENKNLKINKNIMDKNILNYQIKTFDIIPFDENNFIAYQEKSFQNKATCLRVFHFDKGTIYKFNIKEEIKLEYEPLKKNDTLYLISNEKESSTCFKYNYLAYGTNDKKYFIVYDLVKRINIAKINTDFFYYKFFGNVLLYQYQNELVQFIFKEDDFILVSKLPFDGVIFSVNFLKDYTLVLDDNNFIYMYSYEKGN